MQKKIAAAIIAEALSLVDESVDPYHHVTNVEHDPSDDTVIVHGIDPDHGDFRIRLDIMSGRWDS